MAKIRREYRTEDILKYKSQIEPVRIKKLLHIFYERGIMDTLQMILKS